MNSCLQCLISIDQLKEHFLYAMYKEKFAGPKNVPRIRNHFRLSLAFSKFYQLVFLKKNH